MTAEIWKYVDGTDGVYKVSSLGRVKRMACIQGMTSTYPGEELPEAVIPGYINEDGYHKVWVAGKQLSVHRLVAMAFCSGYKPGLQVNHIDCVRTHNTPDNLEWVTARQNQQHTCAVGNLKHKVLTLQELASARQDREGGFTCAEIAKVYGVSEEAIRAATRDMGINSKPPITERVIADIRKRRAAGDTMKSIATALGIGHTAVWRHSHDVLGYKRRTTPNAAKISDERVEAMRLQRWATGDSYREIARAQGVSRPTVRLYCKDIPVSDIIAT